jgi:hypothetical protein
MSDESDPLESQLRDDLVAVGRAVANTVPLFGGAIGELLTVGVRNQRTERIVAYIRMLETRIESIEAQARVEMLKHPEKIDLIEEGAFQAARATNEMRIEQIVELVANGLTAAGADIIRRKRLATLLGELDDDEVALLNAYGQSYGGGDRMAFSHIQRPERTHLGSSPEAIENDRLFQAGKDHLLRLELLKRNYGPLKKGQLPEWDARVGDFKHNVEIAYLGRLMLKEIGMATPFDKAQATKRTPTEDST